LKKKRILKCDYNNQEDSLANVQNDDPESLLFDENSVHIENNKIYFYSEVDRPNVLKLITSLNFVNKQLKNRADDFDLNSKDSSLNIQLHVNSFGGSLLDCMSAINHIKGSKFPVNTYVNGYAASCGSLMSVIGKTRYMFEHSFHLCHSLSGGAWGKFEDLEDES
jgi:ATP-dependent protease ClpP protease subunit